MDEGNWNGPYVKKREELNDPGAAYTSTAIPASMAI